MKSKQRIAITDGIKVRTVSEKNLERFLKSSKGEGWRVYSVSKKPAFNEKKPFEKVVSKAEIKSEEEVKKTPKETKEEVSGIPQEERDAMIANLKEKGIRVHWNLSDEKLLKTYQDEA